MRTLAVAFGLVLLSFEVSGECITIRWTARKFIARATDAARAYGIAPETVRVTEVLVGDRLKIGDSVRLPQHGCCLGTAEGVDYYIQNS